jgi:hypothetical protein
VPVDAHLTLRFSHGVRPETLSEQTGAKS